MDKIFYNGIISTLDENDTFAEAVGIKNGKIEFVGTTDEALKIPCSQKIDLNKKLMLPGFVDSHLHAVNYAFVESSVKLFDCKSVTEAVDMAKARLLEKKDSKWLYCRGWNEENFSVGKYPHKSDLDAVSSQIPVIMVRVCGHIAVCNSFGLEKLKGIKEFNEIRKDVDFETGLIKENAVQFFYSVLDKPSKSQVEEYIKLSMERLNQKGITGIQSDDFASLPGRDWQLILDAYDDLSSKNAMTVRVYEQCLFERIEDLKDFIQQGYKTGQGSSFFTIGPVKLLQDGSLGAKTAALCLPYEGDSSNCGITIFTQKQLDEIAYLCNENGLQMAVHCIGDKAMEMVISALEKAGQALGSDTCQSRRHGIVHAQITNAQILDKMKKNKLAAYIQPVFTDLDMNVVESRIGPERMDKVYAWKSMLDMGILTVGGSDAPVVSFDVMENIYFAVTRKNIHGEPEKGWLPEERLSVKEAVKLFTKYPSYTSFTENLSGTIEIGKYADLVVLEENIYATAPEDIKNIRVSMTVCNGNIVYDSSCQ